MVRLRGRQKAEWWHSILHREDNIAQRRFKSFGNRRHYPREWHCAQSARHSARFSFYFHFLLLVFSFSSPSSVPKHTPIHTHSPRRRSKDAKSVLYRPEIRILKIGRMRIVFHNRFPCHVQISFVPLSNLIQLSDNFFIFTHSKILYKIIDADCLRDVYYTSKLMKYQEIWKSSYMIACIRGINLHE